MKIKTSALCSAVLAAAFTFAQVQGAFAGDVPFPDVPESSFAYDAIRQLSADGFLTGYPNGTFDGNRTMTRYEVSYLIAKIVDAMKERIALGKTPPPNDIALINKLASSVDADLKDVAARVDTLQKQTVAVKAEADATRDQVRAAQIQVNVFQRPGTYSQTVAGFNGPTALLHGTIAANGGLPGGLGPAPLGNGILGATSQGTNLGQNTLTTGSYQHGTNWQETRLVFTGTPSENLSYYVRLENKYIFDGANYQSSTSPSACTSTTAATLAGVNACNSQAYDTGNSLVRLNQAYLLYTSPVGYFLKVGRWQEDEGTASILGMGLGGNYTNGVQLGFRNKRLSAYTAYGYNDSALTNQALNNTNCPVFGNTTPVCVNQSQQLLLGMVSYDVSPRTNLLATYDDTIGKGFALWNASAGLCAPSATAPAGTASATTVNAAIACPTNTALIPGVRGAYQTVTTGLVTGTWALTQFIGSKLKVSAEFSHRFGNDPTTRSPWAGANTYGAAVDYSSHGISRPGPFGVARGSHVKNANVFELAWVAADFNGLSPDSAPAGTTPYQSFYFNSLNGFQYGWITAQHYFSDTFRAGIVYEHFSTLPGQDQPAGSVTCPGCFLKVTSNALFLETYLNL